LDSSQPALKYLKDTETNIHNIIIITGDFNIRDSLCDTNFQFHSVHSDTLFDITDSFSLTISKPSENFPTRFLDNNCNSNSVLDLVFLCPSSLEFNHHHIHLNGGFYLTMLLLPLIFPFKMKVFQILVKGSDEEKQFIDNLIQVIKNMNTTSIHDAKSLEEVVQYLASKIEKIWFEHSKMVNIIRHSKAW